MNKAKAVEIIDNKMHKLRMSQADLARKLGVTQSAVSKALADDSLHISRSILAYFGMERRTKTTYHVRKDK